MKAVDEARATGITQIAFGDQLPWCEIGRPCVTVDSRWQSSSFRLTLVLFYGLLHGDHQVLWTWFADVTEKVFFVLAYVARYPKLLGSV
jgi:hypothetical protein